MYVSKMSSIKTCKSVLVVLVIVAFGIAGLDDNVWSVAGANITALPSKFDCVQILLAVTCWLGPAGTALQEQKLLASPGAGAGWLA